MPEPESKPKKKRGGQPKTGPDAADKLLCALVVITGSPLLAYNILHPTASKRYARDYVTLRLKRPGMTAQCEKYREIQAECERPAQNLTPDEMDQGIMLAAYRTATAHGVKPADRARALECYTKLRDRLNTPKPVDADNTPADLRAFIDTL